jgi:hypothetical protein
MRTVPVLVVLLVSVASAQEFPQASLEVEEAVREVLPDIIRRGVPDYPQPRRGPVLVLDVMADARTRLSKRALPNTRTPKFKLFRYFTADAEATLTGRSSRYVHISSVSLEPGLATVVVGGDYVINEPFVVKMCCCAAAFTYRRESGRWALVKVETTSCV